MNEKTLIMDSQQAERKLCRIAYEIIEHNRHEEELVLAGILPRGLDIANILREHIETISSIRVRIIRIDMDKNNPQQARLLDAADISNKTIIVVDDVANSGRTALYAIRLFLDSNPKRIQLAVLVDRKHKQYPVSSDYIGMTLSTTLQDHIHVSVQKGKVKKAWLE